MGPVMFILGDLAVIFLIAMVTVIVNMFKLPVDRER